MIKTIIKIMCISLAVLFVLSGCGTADNNSSDAKPQSSDSAVSGEETEKVPESTITRTNFKFKNAYGYSVSTSTKVDFGVINNLNLYAPGDEIKYFIDISGDKLNGQVAHIEFYNNDFGVKQSAQHTIATDEKGKQTIEGTITTDKNYKNGVYTLECVIDGFDKPLQFNVGIVPRAKRASDDFYYGVQSYITRCKNTGSYLLNYQNVADTTVSKFATLDYMGCNMIREEVTNFGGMWENESDKIDPSVIENDIKLAKQLGVTYLWLATGSPTWAIKDEYKDSKYSGWQLPPRADVWKKYISTVGKYYKDYDNIIFEIWNEADWEFFMGTKEDYFEHLDIAIKELTAISDKIRILPSACVSGWELSKDGATESKGRSFYFSHYLPYIQSGTLLGLNIHDHQLFNKKLVDDYKNPTAATNETMALGYTQEEFQRKWVTESGVWGKDSDLHRAQTLTNKMLFYRATGAKSFVTWEFGTQANKTSEWALLSDTLEPQIGVIAWTYQVGLLGNAKLEKHIDSSTGAAFADIYYDGNKTIVPFYSRADGTDSLSVKGAHKAYDMFGNEISATGKYDGSKNCIYIIFDGKVDASAFTLSAM